MKTIFNKYYDEYYHFLESNSFILSARELQELKEIYPSFKKEIEYLQCLGASNIKSKYVFDHFVEYHVYYRLFGIIELISKIDYIDVINYLVMVMKKFVNLLDGQNPQVVTLKSMIDDLTIAL